MLHSRSLLIIYFIHSSVYIQLTLLFIYLFIYLWLRWVFVAVHRLSLVAASRATLRCGAGFSLWWPLAAEHRFQARGLQ